MLKDIGVLNREFVPSGTLVIEQNTFGHRAFMIQSGKVEVFLKSKEGEKIVLAELGENAILGEMAHLSDGVRKANVRTIEDSVLIYITAHKLEESMKKSQDIHDQITSTALKRAKELNKHLEIPELENLGFKISDKSQLSEKAILLINEIKY